MSEDVSRITRDPRTGHCGPLFFFCYFFDQQLPGDNLVLLSVISELENKQQKPGGDSTSRESPTGRDIRSTMFVPSFINVDSSGESDDGANMQAAESDDDGERDLFADVDWDFPIQVQGTEDRLFSGDHLYETRENEYRLSKGCVFILLVCFGMMIISCHFKSFWYLVRPRIPLNPP